MKNRPLRFYLQFCSGILAILAAVIFFIIDRNLMGNDIHFNDFSYLTLIFIIAGGLIAILDAFLPLPYLGTIGCVAYGFGIGCHFYIAFFPIADTIQPVAFFTNNIDKARAAVTLFMTFLVIFLLIAVISVVSNFLSERKKAEA